MEGLSMLLTGFTQVLQPENLLFLVGGVAVGMLLGAIPGLSATMAIALVIPMTYYLTPTQSLIMLLGAYNAGTFGGSMAAILIGTPGTVAASATVTDGYAMAKKGQAAKAIKTALFSSCFGCLFSSIILVIIAQPIAQVALQFGPAEYAILMLFALTIIASASGKSLIKGLLGGCIGLFFGCVGMDTSYTIPRLTFGSLNLSSGIDLVVMLIGALALSEVLRQVESVASGHTSAQLPPPTCKEDTKFTKEDFFLCLPHWIRSSLLGCGIGALPGLGPSLACYIGYDFGHRTAKHKEDFGHGAIEGVAAAEAANNAVCGANMIPLLALGVPGDTGAALLVSAFIVQGLTPGPLIFRESPQTVYNVYAGLILCNLCLLVIALLTYRIFTKICSMETTIIFPCVLAFCVVGVYALNGKLFDVWIMLMFGVIGYLLLKFKFPIATVLIGFILSPLFEKYFRRALVISDGNWGIFFSSPLCWIFWAATIISVVLIVRSKMKDRNLQNGL